MRRRFQDIRNEGGYEMAVPNNLIRKSGGNIPYRCQYNRIHVHLGSVVADKNYWVEITFNSKFNNGNLDSYIISDNRSGYFDILGGFRVDGRIEEVSDMDYWYVYDPSLNKDYCRVFYEFNNDGNQVEINEWRSDVSQLFNIPSLSVTTNRDGSIHFPDLYIEGMWDPSLYLGPSL